MGTVTTAEAIGPTAQFFQKQSFLPSGQEHI